MSRIFFLFKLAALSGSVGLVLLFSGQQPQPAVSIADSLLCATDTPVKLASDLAAIKKDSQKTDDSRPELGVLKGHRWPSRTIEVAFIGGTATGHNRVRIYAKQWADSVGLTFTYVAIPDAQIRVGFDRKGGAWSKIGTLANEVKDGSPTMNLNLVEDDSVEEQYHRRQVLHEFGHGLGAIHEQLSPKSPIQWDRPKVMAYFKDTLKWKEDQILRDVLEPYKAADVDASVFDSKSIMLYWFPPELTLNDVQVPLNTTLSPKDVSQMSRLYSSQ